jgi:peptidoglycan/LPS O-acetylase OafA/YrhL
LHVNLPNDLKSLTSFRFFAAFWVFLFHLRSRISYEDNWFWGLVDNGARGVDFFFILSGFVIFHVYEGPIKNGELSRRSYLIKRFARIYPLHIVMLLIFLLIAIAGSNQIHGVFASVFLLHSWGLTDGLVLNGPSWTLSAEMFAYILFGVIVVRSPPTWVITIAFFATAIGVHFFSLMMGKTAFLHLTWDYGSLRIVPLFILGMLLRRLTPRVSILAAALMGIAGLLILLLVATSGPVGYEILVPFVLIIVSGARLSDCQNLPSNNKILVYLGEISYSVYMVHIFVIAAFFEYLPKLGAPIPPWPVICIALVMCSSVSYHLIEVPSRLWINKFAYKYKKRR